MATDPLFDTAVGFEVLSRDDPWYFTAGEIADVCTSSDVLREAGFVAQRYWSNAAALARENPCIPAAPGAVHYAASVEPTTTARVAAGASITLAIHGWSQGPVAPWYLAAQNVVGDFDPMPVLDATAMQNGGVAHVTFRVPAATLNGSSAFVRVLSYRSVTDFHPWPVAITVP